jgi:hypothetical protein
MGINSGSKTAADNTYQQRFPTWTAADVNYYQQRLDTRTAAES